MSSIIQLLNSIQFVVFRRKGAVNSQLEIYVATLLKVSRLFKVDDTSYLLFTKTQFLIYTLSFPVSGYTLIPSGSKSIAALGAVPFMESIPQP